MQNAAHLGRSTDGDAEHVVASHQVAAGRFAATATRRSSATARAVNVVLFDVAFGDRRVRVRALTVPESRDSGVVYTATKA